MNMEWRERWRSSFCDCGIAELRNCGIDFLNFNSELRRLVQLVFILAALPLAAQSYETVYSAHLRNGFAIRHYRSEVVGDRTRLYLGREQSAGYAEVATAEIASLDAEQIIAEDGKINTEDERFREENLDTLPPAAQTPQVASLPFMAPKPKPIPELIASASNKTNIDADFIASVIHAESGFNPRARSPKGAQGLMQLMPQTASQLGVRDAYDAEANVNGGSEYLRQLLEQYQGDAQKALAAYNAGPHRVSQYRGVPPYRETRQYVARVINDYNRKKRTSVGASAKKTDAAAGVGQLKVKGSKLKVKG